MIGCDAVISCLVNRIARERIAFFAGTLNKFDQLVADYIFCPWPKQPYAPATKTEQAETCKLLRLPGYPTDYGLLADY